MVNSRLRLKDLIDQSEFAEAVGACASDFSTLALEANSAQRRLLYARETNITGFWGAWAELAYNVDPAAPYITLPRGAARIMGLTVCTHPVPIRNGIYEYLAFGAGKFPKSSCQGRTCDPSEVYSRGLVATSVPITAGHQLRVRVTEDADVSLRALISGTDNNDQQVTSLDGPLQVAGEFVQFAAPLVDTTHSWNSIYGIQKDITQGPVNFYDYDPVEATETLILTMEPGEQVASYQRYFLGGLPQNCCTNPQAAVGTTQVSVMVKLDLVPVRVPTDYLLIQNPEALVCEARAGRFAKMDSQQAILKGADQHRQAIRYLNGELAHYVGHDQTAVNFAPFGSARLSCQRIGSMM